jgi:hypothetical protein
VQAHSGGEGVAGFKIEAQASPVGGLSLIAHFLLLE